MYKIAITGHRPNKLFGYNLYNPQWINLGKKIRNKLLEYLNQYSSIECITGMALGVDQLFGLVALKLKEQKYNIEIFCAIPCLNHCAKWKDNRYWLKIFNNADKINYITNSEYTPWCMQKRNEFMVDRADELWAVWDGTSGGTYNCIKYAQTKNKKIFNFL